MFFPRCPCGEEENFRRGSTESTVGAVKLPCQQP